MFCVCDGDVYRLQRYVRNVVLLVKARMQAQAPIG